MDRRSFLGFTGVAAGALAAPAVIGVSEAAAAPDTGAIERALAGVKRLPGTQSYMVRVTRQPRPWQAAYQPAARLFVGSAIKTFILTKFLQDVEAGTRSEASFHAVNNAIRSLSSPVFEHLTGKVPARSALEAMIAHSDNTATDISLKAVGVERVRKLVAGAGLTSVAIPASTRTMLSFLAGAPFGVDAGWAAMEKIAAGGLLGTPRSPMNNRETMKGSVADFVTHYENALAGHYFKTTQALTEFRRISSMADALWQVVPPNMPAYGKGGSIEWRGFNCFCLAGQMLIGGVVPVTFAFTVNWEGKPASIPQVQERLGAAIAETLIATAAAFG